MLECLALARGEGGPISSGASVEYQTCFITRMRIVPVDRPRDGFAVVVTMTVTEAGFIG